MTEAFALVQVNGRGAAGSPMRGTVWVSLLVLFLVDHYLINYYRYLFWP